MVDAYLLIATETHFVSVGLNDAWVACRTRCDVSDLMDENVQVTSELRLHGVIV